MKKTILIIAILLGMVSRIYDFRERYNYNHDNDLSAWIVKDIVIDHHFRLIGQLTSSPGIFIGPLFYYSLIPFFLATGMDPIGTVAYSWIVGLVAIASLYFVFRRLYSPFAGNIASLVYAVSYAFSSSERMVVPTTPVMLWSIWFFYAINLWLAGNKKSLWMLAILFGLVWHIHLALALLFPIVLFGFFLNRKSLKLKDFALPVIILLILTAPLLAFEARHNFQQTRALVNIFNPYGVHPKTSATFVSKLYTTVRYAARNSTALFWAHDLPEPGVYVLPAILLIGLFALRFNKRHVVMYALWLFFYILFFSKNPITLSEYYLDGLNILSLAGFVFIIEWLWQKTGTYKIAVCLILAIFLARNFGTMLTSGSLGIGYVERKAVVAQIAADAAKHNYPCVAVSYITAPGYNFGYRYFFYLAGLHVNQPASNSPVYTIVYPKSLADRPDYSNATGAIGLIYPDYGKYNSTDVATSCQGEDQNLTGNMFGFVK